VESLVRGYRRASRGEDLEDGRRQRAERYLDMYTDEDGMVVIRGRLPQEVAALVEKALQAAMDMLREEERSNDDSAESSAPSVVPAAGIPQPRIDVQPSYNSAELCRCEDFGQRRADALGLLAEAALGQGLDRTERGEPYQVMIHVDADVLADQSHEGRSELGDGEGISAESCQRLACDAPHVTVGQDAEGNVLHMGRKTRRIAKPLWRALIGRDRTCQFPSCDRTKHLQAHHIEHWAKGGETTPDNLVLLCRAHHWAVHEGGVRVERRAPLGHVFHRPDGTPLPISPSLVAIHGEAGETLKEANRRYGLEITSKTVDCFWDGERMDLHMAVDALLTYDDAD